jgi:hypothetical protein
MGSPVYLFSVRVNKIFTENTIIGGEKPFSVLERVS